MFLFLPIFIVGNLFINFCSFIGNSFYKSETGDYWKSYIFIEHAKTYQLVETPNHFYNSGRAFGKFQQYLAHFHAERLNETIPDFHNAEKIYNVFLEVVNKDVKGRVKEVVRI